MEINFALFALGFALGLAVGFGVRDAISLSPSACTPTKGISRSINGAAGGQRQPLISAAQFDLASRLVDDHKQARDRWRFRVRRSLCSRPARTTQEQAAALLNYQTEYLAEKFHGTAN
jgi:hypothetical protein